MACALASSIFFLCLMYYMRKEYIEDAITIAVCVCVCVHTCACTVFLRIRSLFFFSVDQTLIIFRYAKRLGPKAVLIKCNISSRLFEAHKQRPKSSLPTRRKLDP